MATSRLQPQTLIISNLLSLATSHAPTPPVSCLAGAVKITEKGPEKSKSLVCRLSDKNDTVEIHRLVETVRAMFRSMDMGETSTSPYDTAWVGLVPSLEDPTRPQFPKTLDWIIDNQLLDGSWGMKDVFLAYDRVLNTLACVVALKTWNIGHNAIQQGVDFICSNLSRIEMDPNGNMLCGFEVVFPTLLEDAKALGLNLPYESRVIRNIIEERNKKLDRIPMELIYCRPTSLLYSLEGLHRILDWNRILKFQDKDGSFLSSPASTACAFKYTRDEKCLTYLQNLLTKFNNAVPNTYPVDLFERVWVVDRLERLGIDRYFRQEIKECLDYVHNYWTMNGLSWSSNCTLTDVDDTCMAFRLLRLHGYDVSPEVFKAFENDKKFFCLEGQTNESLTVMCNLYRASQIMLADETILQDMNSFSKAFILERQRNNETSDKWVITESLKGEVEHILKHPWRESLPRIESRSYIDLYGTNDVWIAKILYRLYFVNNETFLKLAKLDYNFCQACHRRELAEIHRWTEQCCFQKLPFVGQMPLECFFPISATIFEPEYTVARVAWTKCNILVRIIDDFFNVHGSHDDIVIFSDVVNRWDTQLAEGLSVVGKIVFFGLYNTINDISQHGYIVQGREIRSHLNYHVSNPEWQRLISAYMVEATWKENDVLPSLEEYMDNAKITLGVEVCFYSTIFFLGENISEEQISHVDNLKIMDLVNVIGRINSDLKQTEGKISCLNIYLHQHQEMGRTEAIRHFKSIIDHNMKLLVGEYIQKSSLSRPYKLLHLYTAKAFNFLFTHCDDFYSTTHLNQYVNEILFSPFAM